MSPGSGPTSSNLSRSGLILLLVLVISVSAFGVVGFLHFEGDIPAYQLLDDTTDFARVKWYTGLFSNLVILLWSASATVCAFASQVLRDVPSLELRRLRDYLLAMSAINIFLTFDDLFLIHEQAARFFFGRTNQHFGEGFIFGLLAGSIALCIWVFRDTVRRTNLIILVGAIASLAGSMVIDVGFQLELSGNNPFRETVLSVSWGATTIDILEEMLKLNGALLWFAYFVTTGLSGVRDAMGERAA